MTLVNKPIKFIDFVKTRTKILHIVANLVVQFRNHLGFDKIVFR